MQAGELAPGLRQDIVDNAGGVDASEFFFQTVLIDIQTIVAQAPRVPSESWAAILKSTYFQSAGAVVFSVIRLLLHRLKESICPPFWQPFGCPPNPIHVLPATD